MLGGKHVVTMLHTPGVYYSINPSTRAYQGRVLVFIGDRRLTKEPTPVCLPTTKSWEWHTGPAVADFSKLEAFYADDTNGGHLMDTYRHGWNSGGHRGPVPPVRSGSHC